jgi:hypothetical protein
MVIDDGIHNIVGLQIMVWMKNLKDIFIDDGGIWWIYNINGLQIHSLQQSLMNIIGSGRDRIWVLLQIIYGIQIIIGTIFWRILLLMAAVKIRILIINGLLIIDRIQIIIFCSLWWLHILLKNRMHIMFSTNFITINYWLHTNFSLQEASFRTAFF